MSRAVFVAADPNHRTAERGKLKDLIAEIHGITDWKAAENAGAG